MMKAPKIPAAYRVKRKSSRRTPKKRYDKKKNGNTGATVVKTGAAVVSTAKAARSAYRKHKVNKAMKKAGYHKVNGEWTKHAPMKKDGLVSRIRSRFSKKQEPARRSL